MKDFLKNFWEGLKRQFCPNNHVFQFPVDMEAEQTGDKLYVEKDRYRIEIYEGEKAFYLANGWKEVVK